VFKESEGLLPYLQEPAPRPYQTPVKSSRYLHFSILSSNLHLLIIRGFPTKNLCVFLISPFLYACPANLFLLSL